MPKDTPHRDAREIISVIAHPLALMNDYGDCMLCQYPIATNNGEHAIYCPVLRARQWLSADDARQTERAKWWKQTNK